MRLLKKNSGYIYTIPADKYIYEQVIYLNYAIEHPGISEYISEGYKVMQREIHREKASLET
jgi:hypothetical protein